MRYGSAEALADDLDRWFRHEPILARPSSAWESTQKWMWRNPVVASLTAATVLLLIAITVGSLVAASRIAKARQKAEENSQKAEENRQKAEENLYAADMHEAETAPNEVARFWLHDVHHAPHHLIPGNESLKGSEVLVSNVSGRNLVRCKKLLNRVLEIAWQSGRHHSVAT